MHQPTEASYGKWQSPISAELIAKGTVRIAEVHGDDGIVYWSEMRSTNKGRTTLVCRYPDGTIKDLTPAEFDVRTRVHEYGGGSFIVHNGIVYASCGSDARIYRIIPGKAPEAITPESENGTVTRFADMQVTSFGILAVGETHGQQGVDNFIALIDPDKCTWKEIVGGHDFYASPTLSSDGKQIAWICWNHPNMPWTNNELWVASVDEKGTLTQKHKISGENESIAQPRWHADGMLYFVSDRNSGWWNFHRYLNGVIENICPMEAETSCPQWNLKMSTWAFLNDEQIIFGYNKEGLWQLAVLDLSTRNYRDIGEKTGLFSNVRNNGKNVFFLEFPSDRIKELKQIDQQLQISLLTVFDSVKIDKENMVKPTHITFQSEERIAHAFFHPPHNPDYIAPEGELPPIIVICHGGPTGQCYASLSLEIKFWTSRGFGLLDVNYGGSTGYGREYRSLLDKNWGIVDVEDCANAALFLVSKGWADPNRLIIRGGSAGGYTTLAALAFTDVFKAGASYYGVADIEALALDTHKFESRYMEQLVGKYPEEKEVWRQRSPINSVEKIKSPLIIFQGENDKVVPPNQATMIYEALKKQGIPTELYIYPGEEHGFRQAKNIINSLERELEFYQKVL